MTAIIKGKIHTILGPIAPEEMKRCLTHEHLNLYGCTPPPIGIRKAARKMIVPELVELRERYRCNALVECTPEGCGRDLETYVHIAKKAQFHVIVCAGFYVYPRTPAWYEGASVRKIAQHLIKELTEGIDGTGIRAGILKGSGNRKPMWALEHKGFLAAAIAHQETGAPVTTHCGPGRLQAEFLLKEGVAPERISIGHVGSNPLDYILAIADSGCTLLFTGIAKLEESRVLQPALELLKRGHAERIMFSVDHWYEAENKQTLKGSGQRYSLVFDDWAKLLRKRGVSAKDLEQIFLHNPRKMLAW